MGPEKNEWTIVGGLGEVVVVKPHRRPGFVHTGPGHCSSAASQPYSTATSCRSLSTFPHHHSFSLTPRRLLYFSSSFLSLSPLSWCCPSSPHSVILSCQGRSRPPFSLIFQAVDTFDDHDAASLVLHRARAERDARSFGPDGLQKRQEHQQ